MRKVRTDGCKTRGHAGLKRIARMLISTVAKIKKGKEMNKISKLIVAASVVACSGCLGKGGFACMRCGGLGFHE